MKKIQEPPPNKQDCTLSSYEEVFEEIVLSVGMLQPPASEGGYLLPL